MTDTKELHLLTQAVVKGWGNCDQAWLDQSEDTPAAVVGHIDEDGETYPVATIDCDQYYAGHQSLPLAKFYAAANPAAISELLDRLEAAEKERDELRESEKWYRRRCDLLQEQQSKMRDPERTIVCDILANGVLLHADFAGDRYTIPGEMTDDKRRIDACLSACEGISTQNLEDNVPFLELARRYNVVLRERDALRAENEALAANLRGKHSTTGATYAHLIEDRDDLRTKIAEMEQQEPVGTALLCTRCSTPFDGDYYCPACGYHTATEKNVYALPGAQPAPSVPEGVSFIDTSQLEGVVSTEIVHSYPPPSGWLRAIDEALVVTHLGVANASDTYEQAKAKLDNLIGFHVDVATDPDVNGGWKLVPVVSTDEMDSAGSEHCDGYLSTAQVVWDAMLAAAPGAKP